MSYFYISLTIVFTVYGQLVIKWQILKAGTFPENGIEKLWFLGHLLLNPWVISSLLAALLASIAWMAAMTKLQLSHAYPFMGLAFILVMICSGMLLNEPITTPKVVGLAFVVIGLAIGSNG